MNERTTRAERRAYRQLIIKQLRAAGWKDALVRVVPKEGGITASVEGEIPPHAIEKVKAVLAEFGAAVDSEGVGVG